MDLYREKQKAQDIEQEQEKQQEQPAFLGGARCPHCGELNEPGALFCENCGSAIESGKCPSCGSPLPAGADFCEKCKSYVAKDKCSFCGALMSPEDAFCPECGAPRQGIVCPVCHAHNKFSFCSVCGTPLTEMASKQLSLIQQEPQYARMNRIASDLRKLLHVIPVTTPGQIEKEKRNEELRNRILALLNQKPSVLHNNVPGAGLDKLALKELIARKRKELQEILEETKVQPQESPVMARNYAMAHRPMGSSLGWKCNFKHAIHTGPFGCACPQMGGKWIVLDGLTETQVLDDK